jgi:acyl-coenzyme A synthetase/AMP-(fatty) acid ligase
MQRLSQLSISSFLEYWAVNTPNAIYCSQIDGEAISFELLHGLVGKYAAFLVNELKVKPNQHVVIKIDNSLEFVVVFYAVISIGAVACPVPANMTDYELSEVISLLGPILLILRKPSNGCKVNSILIESYEKLIASIKNIEPIFLFLDASVNYSCIFLSSGTTAKPKAIKHNSQTLAKTAFTFSKKLGFTQNTPHLAFLPCGHTSFIGHSLIPTLVSGGLIYIARNYLSVSRKLWNYVSEKNIQYIQTVPTIIGSMLGTDFDRLDNKNHNLKYVACGSAPLSKKYIDSFKSKFNLPLINFYGLSEIGAIFYNDPKDINFDPYSIGKPFDKVKLKLLGADGAEVNIGEVGELLIDSPSLFQGYHNKDIATSSFMEGGYFKTGDLLSKNHAGNYFFHGRVNELIVKAGINISPREIEELLLGHPKVRDVAVFGYKDDLMGEEICCCYISDNTLDLSEDLKKLCRNTLSEIKRPKKFINLSEFPSTYSGKIIKKELKRLFLEGNIF